mmetsp:Transcript_29480/g.74074  ORF Transcript_29480/g.74074 Transcript_29480/m.74074 type:complete len:110 (+) Transcript_29480:228-557(+)
MRPSVYSDIVMATKRLMAREGPMGLKSQVVVNIPTPSPSVSLELAILKRHVAANKSGGVVVFITACLFHEPLRDRTLHPRGQHSTSFNYSEPRPDSPCGAPQKQQRDSA